MKPKSLIWTPTQSGVKQPTSPKFLSEIERKSCIVLEGQSRWLYKSYALLFLFFPFLPELIYVCLCLAQKTFQRLCKSPYLIGVESRVLFGLCESCIYGQQYCWAFPWIWQTHISGTIYSITTSQITNGWISIELCQEGQNSEFNNGEQFSFSYLFHLDWFNYWHCYFCS